MWKSCQCQPWRLHTLLSIRVERYWTRTVAAGDASGYIVRCTFCWHFCCLRLSGKHGRDGQAAAARCGFLQHSQAHQPEAFALNEGKASAPAQTPARRAFAWPSASNLAVANQLPLLKPISGSDRHHQISPEILLLAHGSATRHARVWCRGPAAIQRPMYLLRPVTEGLKPYSCR